MAICNPSCLTALPTFDAVNDCDLQKSFASGEIAQLILGVCNLTFTDILDATEWTTKKTANLITIPFGGNGNLGETSFNNPVRVKCKDVSTSARKPFEFNSPIVDNDTNSEWSLYNDIIANKENLGIMFLTCDGNLLISPDWTTGENPLLTTATINVNQMYSGESDSVMMYKINGELTEYRALKRVKLTQAVLNVINA